MEGFYLLADSKDLGSNLVNVNIKDSIPEDFFKDNSRVSMNYTIENYIDASGDAQHRTISITLYSTVYKGDVFFYRQCQFYPQSRDYIVSPDIGGPDQMFNTFSIRPCAEYETYRKHFCWRKIELQLEQWMKTNSKFYSIIRVDLSYPANSDIPTLITYKIALSAQNLSSCPEKKKIVKLIKECDDSFSFWDLVPVVGNIRTISSGVKNIKKGEKVSGSVKIVIGGLSLIADAVTLGQLGSFVKGVATGACKLGAGAVAKEAAKATGKEAVAIAAQELGKNFGKKTTKEVAKEIGKKAASQLTKEIGKKTAEEIGKQTAKKVAAEATKEIGKKVVKEAATHATKEIGKKAAQEIGKQTAKKVATEATKEIGKKVAKEAAIQATKELGKQTAKKVGTQTMKEVGKKVAKEAATQATKEIGKKAAEEIGKQTAKQVATQATKEVGKKVAKEAATQATKEIGKKAAEGLGKEAAKKIPIKVMESCATVINVVKGVQTFIESEQGKQFVNSVEKKLLNKHTNNINSQDNHDMPNSEYTTKFQSNTDDNVKIEITEPTRKSDDKKSQESVGNHNNNKVNDDINILKDITKCNYDVQVSADSIKLEEKSENILESESKNCDNIITDNKRSLNNVKILGKFFNRKIPIIPQINEFLLGAFGITPNIVNATFIERNIVSIECSNKCEEEQLLKLNTVLKLAKSDIYFEII